LVLLVLVLVLVVGCAAPGSSISPSATATQAATSSVLDTAGSLVGLRACALLSPAQLARLGQGAGQATGDTLCYFPSVNGTGTELNVQLIAGATASGNGPGQRKLVIGRHRAVESAQSMTSQCDINLVVGRNVIVVIGTGTSAGIGPACTVALDAARLIEAALP
jgi:hypothetical protein